MQRTTARFTKGEEYECNVTIDHVWYQNWYTKSPLPTTEYKMRRLRYGNVLVQQGGATPPADHDILHKLNSVDREARWSIELVAQSARSLDLNMYYLRFFVSLKSGVWKQGSKKIK